MLDLAKLCSKLVSISSKLLKSVNVFLNLTSIFVSTFSKSSNRCIDLIKLFLKDVQIILDLLKFEFVVVDLSLQRYVILSKNTQVFVSNVRMLIDEVFHDLRVRAINNINLIDNDRNILRFLIEHELYRASSSFAIDSKLIDVVVSCR